MEELKTYYFKGYNEENSVGYGIEITIINAASQEEAEKIYCNCNMCTSIPKYVEVGLLDLKTPGIVLDESYYE